MERAWTTIGLMSGTSTDGITAVVARLRPTAGGYAHRVLGRHTFPFASRLRRRLLRAAEGAAVSAGELSVLNADMGEQLAAAAIAVARRSAIPLRRVDLIGSHGHTVFHGPPGGRRGATPSTLQIGEPAVIAARTGITTVADFRPADVALGGQGAPLVPHVHWLLFRHRHVGHAIHNLGGIANLTYLAPGCSRQDIVAFDSGPGNMVIDAVVAQVSGGRLSYDRGGAAAARGRVHREVVAACMRHPFLGRRPPKSTGREDFGAAFVEEFLRRARAAGAHGDDLVATATEFAAATIAGAYRRFVLPRGPLSAIYVAGGGAYNPTLIRAIQRHLPEAPVLTLDALGVDPMAVEALSFAVLACEAVRGRPGNACAVTGASRPAVLGKIVPGAPEQWRRVLRRARAAV